MWMGKFSLATLTIELKWLNSILLYCGSGTPVSYYLYLVREITMFTWVAEGL